MLFRISQKNSFFRKTYFRCELNLTPVFEGSIILTKNFDSIDEAVNWVKIMTSKYEPKYKEVIYRIGELE